LARKVLLADDSVTAQNMGRKILTDAGYEVVTVNNGSAALKKITETHPDLIVLDVYMPGYSGLEVCQRIKESRDSNHIPVLLTVGKLEPFKQDEARRVRADAFIIKPFEASELMAALSKLESKLAGPAPSSRKEGRQSAPTTMESFERTASASGPQFGDEESGWKSRIKFPSSGPKPPQVEPDPEPFIAPSSGSFRDLEADPPAPIPQNSNVQPILERSIPAGIPADITADEIAAIAAAAARVQAGITVGESSEPHIDAREKTSEQKSVPAGVEEPKTPTVSAEMVTETRVETLASSAAIGAAADDTRADQSVQEKTAAEPTAAMQSRAEGSASAIEVSTSGTTSAVAPDQEESAQSEPAAAAAKEPAAIQTPSPTLASKPRWVAEEVPVEAQEAILVLEREMHKAYAAFAAAEHGLRYESAPVDREDEPIFATMGPPAIGTPLPMMQAASEPATKLSTGQSEPANVSTPSPAPESTFREIASVSEIAKPPAPPFAPAGPVHQEDEHSVAAFGGPQPFGTAAAESKVEVPAAESLAAESKSPAHAILEAPTAHQKSEIPEKAEEKSAEPPSSDSRREAELAAATRAAWANWRDVRESVLAPKPEPSPSSQDTEAELEEFKKLKGLKKEESAPSTLPEAALAAAASADAGASNNDLNLSSIVDTMLAELKTKLMAELAEKLKHEKKK
jgi:CheY-like chemotaxis protein